MRAIVTIVMGMVTLTAGTLLADQTLGNLGADEAIFSGPLAATADVTAASYPSPMLPSYAALATPGPDEAADPQTDITMDQVRDEIKKLMWTKGEMKIIPYGSLWGSMFYHTHRTTTDAYVLYVDPLEEQGDDAFAIDTRRTRLGIDVTGPMIPALGCGTIGGKVEIDFFGAFVTENKPGILLRHAYGEVKNEDFRLLAGQTWDVISPLYPGDLSYSVLWEQGNIGYRRAQIRIERYYHVDCCRTLTLQLSANENIISDFTSTAGVERESPGWPLFEGRVAWTDECPSWLQGPVTLGVSGHIGEQEFDFTPDVLRDNDAHIRTWSGNVDLHAPITKCSGFQGEFFYGSNLGTFLGGIGQGVSTVTHEAIRARGGWVDIWHDWSKCWHSHAGFGVDDPFDRDVVTGRSYNEVYFANMTHDITDFLIVGLEVTAAKTKFINTAQNGVVTITTADSVGLEFTGQYKF
jgi:hypothetical protein